MHLTTDFKIHKANTGRIERRNRHIHSHSWRLQCIYQWLAEYRGKKEKNQQGEVGEKVRE